MDDPNGMRGLIALYVKLRDELNLERKGGLDPNSPGRGNIAMAVLMAAADRPSDTTTETKARRLLSFPVPFAARALQGALNMKPRKSGVTDGETTTARGITAGLLTVAAMAVAGLIGIYLNDAPRPATSGTSNAGPSTTEKPTTPTNQENHP